MAQHSCAAARRHETDLTASSAGPGRPPPLKTPLPAGSPRCQPNPLLSTCPRGASHCNPATISRSRLARALSTAAMTALEKLQTQVRVSGAIRGPGRADHIAHPPGPVYCVALARPAGAAGALGSVGGSEQGRGTAGQAGHGCRPSTRGAAAGCEPPPARLRELTRCLFTLLQVCIIGSGPAGKRQAMRCCPAMAGPAVPRVRRTARTGRSGLWLVSLALSHAPRRAHRGHLCGAGRSVRWPGGGCADGGGRGGQGCAPCCPRRPPLRPPGTGQAAQTVHCVPARTTLVHKHRNMSPPKARGNASTRRCYPGRRAQADHA